MTSLYGGKRHRLRGKEYDVTCMVGKDSSDVEMCIVQERHDDTDAGIVVLTGSVTDVIAFLVEKLAEHDIIEQLIELDKGKGESNA